MNELFAGLPKENVNAGIALIAFLIIFLIVLGLTFVANPTDAHKERQKRSKRFEEGIRDLDRHHGAIAHRRGVIRPLYHEDED